MVVPPNRDRYTSATSVTALAKNSSSPAESRIVATFSLVFGWHYHFAGGSARSGVAYNEFAAYAGAVDSAKAGDHFTLYDLGAVHHLALAESPPTRWDRMRPDGEGLRTLRSLLADSHVELTMVVRGRDTSVESLNQPDGHDWEEIERLWVDPATHVVMFDGIIDHDADGIAVESVTAACGRSRVNALVDGKRPNDAGLVPSCGPY